MFAQLGARRDAILAPVIDADERRLDVERLRRRRAGPMAGDAGGGRIRQAEEPRELLVAHDVGGLVGTPRAVAGLTGDARDRIRPVGALLVARMARKAHRALALFGRERVGGMGVRALGPDLERLGVAGGAAHPAAGKRSRD